MYKNKPYIAARTVHKWQHGFALKIGIQPEMDLNTWTAVLWFTDEVDATLSFNSWETSVTTSVGQRVAVFTSNLFNQQILAGDKYKFLVTIVGAAYEDLPSFNVRYIPGIHEDLSCSSSRNVRHRESRE